MKLNRKIKIIFTIILLSSILISSFVSALITKNILYKNIKEELTEELKKEEKTDKTNEENQKESDKTEKEPETNNQETQKEETKNEQPKPVETPQPDPKEELLKKLNGGWKTKDDTCSLILGGDYGLDYDITTSCYMYINNTYAYSHHKTKKDFVILDNSHFQIGSSAKYFFIKDDNTLIVGSSEYIRVPSLTEEDFSCYAEYPCSIYTK